MSDWFKPMPIFVTRKTGSGEVGSISIAVIWVLLMLLIVMLNFIGWGTYGIIEAVKHLI